MDIIYKNNIKSFLKNEKKFLNNRETISLKNYVVIIVFGNFIIKSNNY